MKSIQDVLRKVLRRLYMGRRDLAYWKALRSLERDPRSRYTPPQEEAARNGKR
jgi:hypothetical protein